VNGVRIGVRSNDKGKATAITSDEEGDGSDIDDSDDSDYLDLDVHFNDSEEERGLAVDDGFEPEVVENVVEGHAEVVENVVEGTSQVVKNVVEGTSQDHEITNDDYESEELDSASDDDGEGASDQIIRYVKFREEDMCKGFKFYVGMELSSLYQFKKVVHAHNVLIGRQVTFKKNDAIRVRVICQSMQTCRYKVFVSRVVKTHTFRVKSLTSKHNCVR
jgi:hypothetical protein